MPTLDTRVISGKGRLRIDKSSDDFKKAKIITLYADVIRKPFNEYLSLNYNPPESRYATLQFLRNGYVIRTEPLKYETQAWDFYLEPSAQTLLAVQCAYQGTLDSIANLGVALGVTPVSIINNIEDWKYIDLFWDEVKVVCYADTGIQLVAVSTDYDLCPEQSAKEPAPPPEPPEPPSLIPPGTPLDEATIPTSAPYDDDRPGDTEPYPGDAPDPQPEFPTGEACQLFDVSYVVVISSRTGGADPPDVSQTTRMYAPILGWRIQRNPPPTNNDQLFFDCRGLRVFGSEPCGTQGERQVLVTGGVIDAVEIISVTPV